MQKKYWLVALLLLVFGLGMFGYKTYSAPKTEEKNMLLSSLEKSEYQADGEIEKALSNLKNQPRQVEVIKGVAVRRAIALTFDGLGDPEELQMVLAGLKKHHVKATFFVDAVSVADNPELVNKILKDGHKVENYTLTGLLKMEILPTERLVQDFCQSGKILAVHTGQPPHLLKCNGTTYTEPVLQAAAASGFQGVVRSDLYWQVKDVANPQAAAALVGRLKPGNIVSMKLKRDADIVAPAQTPKDVLLAVGKPPGIVHSGMAQVQPVGLDEALDRLLTALEQARLGTSYVEEFAVHQSSKATSRNEMFPKAWLAQLTDWFEAQVSLSKAYAAEAPASAEELKVIPTTEAAVSFTFGGLSNKSVAEDVLGRLQRLGIRATFFVFEREMKEQEALLRKIIGAGHEIGLAIRPKEGETEEQTYQSILRGQQLLKERFGVTSSLVKQPWGMVNAETQQAVARAHGLLISQTVNVVQSKHKDYKTAEQVLPELFGKAVFSLGRGQIVHFRMDFYTNPKIVTELISLIKERKIDSVAYAVSFDNPAVNPANNSQYVIKPVGELLSRKDKIYHYPVEVQRVPEELRNAEPGNWNKPERFLSEVSKRYVGNSIVNDEDRMLGFSKSDVRHMDQTGLIHTKEPVIFLSFDDWGQDSSINKLLYVLRKHKVTATFFVITHNVLANPNLLRAMAEEGHTIGSHSDLHKAMAVRDASGRQVPTQNREEYLKDLETSYQKLRDVIGDVTVNGKPMLTRFFRPPTLAISKMGMESLFATGFEYVISGSCSTEDYQEEGVPQLVSTMKQGLYDENGNLRKGAILVMHMTEAACYTPLALDVLLTANEKKANTDPSKFRVANLGDYLTGGYKQFQMKDE